VGAAGPPRAARAAEDKDVTGTPEEKKEA